MGGKVSQLFQSFYSVQLWSPRRAIFIVIFQHFCSLLTPDKKDKVIQEEWITMEFILCMLLGAVLIPA